MLQAVSKGNEVRARSAGDSLQGSKLLDTFLMGTEDLSFPEEFDNIEEGESCPAL